MQKYMEYVHRSLISVLHCVRQPHCRFSRSPPTKTAVGEINISVAVFSCWLPDTDLLHIHDWNFEVFLEAPTELQFSLK